MPAQKIPEGFNTVTPSLNLKDAAKAIELYTKALGAKEVYRMACPETGTIMHACLEIGNSKIFLADTMPGGECAKETSSNFYLYIEDVDAGFKKAIQAGMKDNMAPQDMFWGDRTASVKDSFGVNWTLATHVRDVSQKDMEEGQKQFIAMMKSKAA